MSMRAAGTAMSGQRKRVDHRPGARLQAEVVEPAQHRLGMRHGRRRIPATANCLAGHRVHARLVARPHHHRLGAASVAGPARPRSVASDKNRGLLPTSPDPKPPPAPTGTETIAADPSRGTLSGRRSPARGQLGEIRRDRRDDRTLGINQPIGLGKRSPVVSRPPRVGTTSTAKSRGKSPSLITSSEPSQSNPSRHAPAPR